MNIVQIPRRFVKHEWGGTETVVLQTCKRLQQMGHQTEILCPNALAESNEETIEGVLVKRTPYFYPYLGLKAGAREQMDKKGGNLFSFSLLRELMQYPVLDIVHLHAGKRLGGIGRHAAMMRKIPYVISLHGGLFDVPAGEAATWTEPTQGAWEWGKLLGWWVGSRRVMEDAAAILCVGKAESEKTLARMPDKNVIYLPNGVDVPHFAAGDRAAFRAKHGIPQDARVVLTVGRIDVQKNQLLAADVLKRLLAAGRKDAHLLLIGPVTNPAYLEKVKAACDDPALAGKVTIIPGLDASGQELVDAYKSADVFLLPSVHEPFGIVILEAWSAGLPVVASRVGGVPAFVDHASDGLLFDSGQAEQAAAAVQILLDQPQVAAGLADKGYQKASREYSWDRIADRLVGIYEDAIRENPLR